MKIVFFLFFSLVNSAVADPLWAQNQSAGTASAKEQLLTEERAARARHPDYDSRRVDVLRLVMAEPSLTIEEGYCLVVLGEFNS